MNDFFELLTRQLGYGQVWFRFTHPNHEGKDHVIILWQPGELKYVRMEITREEYLLSNDMIADRIAAILKLKLEEEMAKDAFGREPNGSYP